MGWNGIGIGWPNATSGGSLPTEKYFVVDCIGYRGDVETINYPIGTFSINDRVIYEAGGISTWGLVSSTATPQYTGLELIPTGVNTNQCIDNNIEFISYNQPSELSVEFVIDIKPLNANFISVNNEYTVFFIYYTQGYCVITDGDNFDERPFDITGNSSLNNYNYSQGIQEALTGASQYIGETVVEVYTEYLSQNFYFTNTQGFTDNDCDNHYFLRGGTTQNGSTFYASFINNDC